MTPHRNRKSRFKLIRHFFSCCSIAAILAFVATADLSANTDIPWPPPEVVQKRVESAVKTIDRLQTLVPKPLNDVTDRASSLDFDFDAAIQYVTDDIRYEPYRGVLRGPDGAAAIGAGNAWDQALLLASLIKTMGGDAQIVSGTLSDADARRLLEQAFTKPAAREADTLDNESIAAAFEDFDPDLAKSFRQEVGRFDGEVKGDALASNTARITKELLDLIRQSTPEFSAHRNAEAIIGSIAADYVWVRWRMGPNSKWADSHPAFGPKTAPSPEPQRYFDAEVPPEYHHRVALQLFIERGKDQDSSDPELEPIMSRWDRPTANLYKDQIYLGMAPQSHDGTEDSAVLVPSLNGAMAPGGLAVTRLGLTVDPGAAASAAGKVFATVSSRTGSAAGALGGLSEDRPAAISKMLGVVLKVEIHSPEGQRTMWRRVADLRGLPDAAFPRAGAFQMILDVHVGPENPMAHYHESLQYFRPLLRAVPPMLAMARNALSVDELQSSAAYRGLKSPRWLDFGLFANTLLNPATDRATTFRAGPLVAGRRTGATADGELMTVTDVLWNPSTVLTRSDDGAIHVSTEGAVAQGVRETLLESAFAGIEPGWAARTPSAVIGEADSLKAARFAAWPEAAHAAARADIHAGYLLAVTEGPDAHWWRVDPVSGQTLGMSMHGGSEVLEYAILVVGTAVSVFLFKQSVEECDKTYADNQAMADCCIVGNLLTTYATSAGAAAGGAAMPVQNAGAAATGAINSALDWTAVDIGAGYLIGEMDLVGSACRAKLGQR